MWRHVVRRTFLGLAVISGVGRRCLAQQELACRLVVVHPQNMSRPFHSAQGIVMRACSTCPAASADPHAIVHIDGTVSHSASAHVQGAKRSGNTGWDGVGVLPDCPFLITFTLPEHLLHEARSQCSPEPAGPCRSHHARAEGESGQLVSARSGSGEPIRNVSEVVSHRSGQHDPGWVVVEARIKLAHATAEEIASTSVVLAAGSGGLEGDGPSHAVKRFLFLVSVQSVWPLLDTGTGNLPNFITGDSDVLTLICPMEMPADEWHAYATHELEALQHPNIRVHTHTSSGFETLSHSWTHSELGPMMRRTHCSDAEATALLEAAAFARQTYPFVVPVRITTTSAGVAQVPNPKPKTSPPNPKPQTPP
jgi:hypothetical protein